MVKVDVLFWVLIGFHQLFIWNVHFSNWEHGWSNHTKFWARRLPPELPVEALQYYGLIAFFIAICLASRKRLFIVLGLVLGLPFLGWILYHYWVPYLFGCCGLWYNGGTYNYAKEKTTFAKAIKMWQREYKGSIQIMPNLHGSPFFVDLTNVLLSILVVVAYYYSIKTLLWPHTNKKEHVTTLHATDKEKKEQ